MMTLIEHLSVSLGLEDVELIATGYEKLLSDFPFLWWNFDSH